MDPVKAWWRRQRPSILGSIIYAIIRTIGLTLRLRVVGYERTKEFPGGLIYCGWHGRSVIPGNFFKGRGVWAVISHSRDGDIQSRIFSKFGFQVIRGSTGRGGARALIESIKVLKEGSRMAMTPDGPRGPSGVVQMGVIMMAKKSGAGLVPVGSFSRPRWLIRSWDRFLIPLPFAGASFVLGEAITIDKDATDEEMERVRLLLEVEIGRAQTEAEAMLH